MNRSIHHALPRALSNTTESEPSQVDINLNHAANEGSNDIENSNDPELNVWMSRLRDTWFNDINQMDLEDHRVTTDGLSSAEEDCG